MLGQASPAAPGALPERTHAAAPRLNAPPPPPPPRPHTRRPAHPDACSAQPPAAFPGRRFTLNQLRLIRGYPQWPLPQDVWSNAPFGGTTRSRPVTGSPHCGLRQPCMGTRRPRHPYGGGATDRSGGARLLGYCPPGQPLQRPWWGRQTPFARRAAGRPASQRRERQTDSFNPDWDRLP